MAEYINVNEFKNGMTFLKDGNVMVVLESTHSKSGRGQAHVKTKVKNLSTGSTIDITFTGADKVEKAYVQKKQMQYLYDDGIKAYFMDQETYDQIEIDLSKLEWEKKFMAEGSNVLLTIYQNEVLGIELDKKVILEVVETADAVKGDTVSNATKKAILETGIEIDVPQFIKVNEKIIVNTDDGKYVGKSNK